MKSLYLTKGWRRWSLLALLLSTCAAKAATEAAPAEPKIISKIAGDRRDFQIVSKKFSPDGKEATFTLLEPTGIFAFRLDLSGAKLSKLTLIVQKQKSCEGLTFQPEGQKAVDLKQAKGVKISPQGEDMVIEFNAEAVEKLKPAGRFQFINQYR